MPEENAQLRDVQETLRRFEDKIDKMAEAFIRKDFFTMTQQRLELDIKQNALDIRELATGGAREHAKIREEYELAIKNMSNDWDQLKNSLAKNQVRARDFVIANLVSFLIGGGAIGVVAFVINHH